MTTVRGAHSSEHIGDAGEYSGEQTLLQECDRAINFTFYERTSALFR
ncbi:MAG: hypothetical protein PUP93_10415 [Rhizonema sp. NSF051]|nr:hypothetical protein [Rhizonema sp. NSF051]